MNTIQPPRGRGRPPKPKEEQTTDQLLNQEISKNLKLLQDLRKMIEDRLSIINKNIDSLPVMDQVEIVGKLTTLSRAVSTNIESAIKSIKNIKQDSTITDPNESIETILKELQN